jgi:hypothetical protein
MKILEMFFVQKFCENTKLKILSTKKTIEGNSVWILAATPGCTITSAKIVSTENSVAITFADKGRQIRLGLDLNMALVDKDLGPWEENQVEEAAAFEQRILSYIPVATDWYQS